MRFRSNHCGRKEAGNHKDIKAASTGFSIVCPREAAFERVGFPLPPFSDAINKVIARSLRKGGIGIDSANLAQHERGIL